MTDERSQDHDANSREYWKRVVSNPGEHGHDEGGSRLMGRSHALIDPECWAEWQKDPAKYGFDAEQAEKLATFFCRPHSGGVAVVLHDAHVIAYRAHYWKLLDRIDEKQAEIAEMTAAKKTATDGLPKIKEELKRLNEELAALIAKFSAPCPASAMADTASPPRAESASLTATMRPTPPSLVNTPVERQSPPVATRESQTTQPETDDVVTPISQYRGEDLKKSALVAKHESQWKSIRRDLQDATSNGLSVAAKTSRHGYWIEGAALAWARQRGKLEEAIPAGNAAQLQRTVHLMVR